MTQLTRRLLVKRALVARLRGRRGADTQFLLAMEEAIRAVVHAEAALVGGDDHLGR